MMMFALQLMPFLTDWRIDRFISSNLILFLIRWRTAGEPLSGA